MAAAGAKTGERVRTQAGIWSETALRGDIWRGGAAVLAVAFVVGKLLGPDDEVAQLERVDLLFGVMAVLVIAVIAIAPGERMPDWAIGLRPDRPPTPPAQAPLVNARSPRLAP